jgi:transcriptional regulator with XRE-family HTH domain
MAPKQEVQQLLGQAVKRIRSESGLTQEEVSRRTGMHPTYISDIERGARNPSFEALTRLAAGLDASMAEIGKTYDSLSEESR